MYVWNETEAKRGPSEIASWLEHYVLNILGQGIKKLAIFRDNCSGQNKNINVVLCCLRHIHSNRFITIEHYYMVPGHSYIPCDRDFGNIERPLKNVEVYSVDNYIAIIKNARKTNPFTVIKMRRDSFLNFDALQVQVTKRGVNKAGFKDGKVFIFHENYKMGFQIKKVYETCEPVDVKLQKGRANVYNQESFFLPSIPLVSKYQKPVKLTPSRCERPHEVCPS